MTHSKKVKEQVGLTKGNISIQQYLKGYFLSFIVPLLRAKRRYYSCGVCSDLSGDLVAFNYNLHLITFDDLF